MTITYLTGDATQPVKKPALIMHVCNDVGGWWRGFVLALSRRWPEPERAYRALTGTTRNLGSVQFVHVSDDISVANMIGQHDVHRCTCCGHHPIRYDALASFLLEIGSWLPQRYSIHAPRLGCGLAGGSWSVVEPLIDFYLRDREVYIYDLPGDKS